VAALESRGAHVSVHDPLYSDSELRNLGFDPFHKGGSADVVIIQADHHEYQHWTHLDAPGARLMMDGRGISDQANWEPMVNYIAVGKPYK
jgi:UDP-N-acetyl-D-mannosaminuronate dehydrogenase